MVTHVEGGKARPVVSVVEAVEVLQELPCDGFLQTRHPSVKANATEKPQVTGSPILR